MQGQLQARLVALKAFLIGRQVSPRDRETAKEKAEAARQRLSARTDVESIRRFIFYSLVLAELERERDFLVFREHAMAAGERLLSLEVEDPFPIYMKIVAAMTVPMTTADFGDFNSSPSWSHSSNSVSPTLQHEIDQSNFERAFQASGLDDGLSDELRSFLYNATFESIMRSHGLLN